MKDSRIQKLNLMDFTFIRPQEDGYYYVKWSPDEKPLMIYLKYDPVSESWSWGRNPLDKDFEELHIDVEKPELIQFSSRITNVVNYN